MPRPEEWLLIEWPRGDAEPTKYWLSTRPATTPIADLVRLAKLRWRIERDYQELKDELGLDHFEGRGWVGFHHHLACVAAAHAFLTLERALVPPPHSAPDISEVPPPTSTGTHSNARALSGMRPIHPPLLTDGAAAHVIE